MSETRHRYRFIPSPLVPTWVLANVAAYRNLGIPVGEPGDDLLLFYPVDTASVQVQLAIAQIRADGHEVVTEDGT